MKLCVLLLTFCSVSAHYDEKPSSLVPSRLKRSAVGALHIVTNHAQPIHADVKPESPAENNVKALTEKPCHKGSVPHIEPGVGFKVTPPEDTVTTYEVKSLRKSLSDAPPTALDLIRSVSRVVTLIVLFVSAVLEFYPTFHHLMHNIFNFMRAK